MKKILAVIMTIFFCSVAIFAQEYKIERTEKAMILPDGAVADVSFFKKWGDAGKMNKAVDKQIKSEGKQTVGKKVETDAYLGYGNIIHKEDENEYVKKICEVMRECGATYGVAYADFGERSRSYVFTYFPKGEKRNSPIPELRNAFFDYFYGGHEFYIAYKNNDTVTQDRLNKTNAETMKNNLNEYLREQKKLEGQGNPREDSVNIIFMWQNHDKVIMQFSETEMIRRTNMLKVLALALLIGGIFSGCAERPSADEDGSPAENFTALSVAKWTKGEIVKLKNDKMDEQWFKFVATASTQRVYVKLGTLSDLKAYLYDSSSDSAGSDLSISGSSGKTGYTEYSLSSGATYYIKVTGYNSNYTGTYWIGFTAFPAQPETTITNLSENKWMDGNIVSSSSGGTGEQWFKFVATSSKQRIYTKLSTTRGLYAYLYDSGYNPVGGKLDVHGDVGLVKYFEYSVNVGETYYVQVTHGYYSDCYGTYKIGFTEFIARPESVITTLTENKWTNENIIHPDSDGSGEQWFKFVATSSTQYVYTKLNTTRGLYAYLYDTDYNRVGGNLDVHGDVDKIGKHEFSLTAGKTYYIQVTHGYYSDCYGTYWITFNSTGTEPQ